MKRFLQRRRLRKLQRAYYDAPAKDDAIIVRYLDELRAARGTMRPGRALHAGSGGHNIDGWINVDRSDADVLADLSFSIPFRSESLDYIHSEDFIEHLELAGGRQFIAEAYRVLKRGGVMRVLTPELRALIQKIYIDRDPRHIRWCDVQLDARGACESLNMHLRMNGEHRFIYDEEHLAALLTAAGFKVRRASWNRSRESALRFLDLRDFGLNLFLEAVK